MAVWFLIKNCMVKLTPRKPLVNTRKPTTWGFAAVSKAIHQLIEAGHGNSPDSSQGLNYRSSKLRPYLQKNHPGRWFLVFHLI